MRIHITVITSILLTLASCDNPRIQEKSNHETPKALEDKSNSYEIVSKRGEEDLVESLYDELADKTPELKQLENRIDILNKSKSDSAKSFDTYNGKNQSFYNSAENHIGQVKDSVLRDKLKILISSSLTRYKSRISRHSDLLKLIETETLTLNDLHTVLKISRTLPLIERYQNDNLPATKSLQGYLNQLNETLKYSDTLTKE